MLRILTVLTILLGMMPLRASVVDFYDVRPVSAGPRVGLVTETTALLHGRGEGSVSRETYLVARLSPFDGTGIYPDRAFRLGCQSLCSSENDYCGVIRFQNLNRGEKYFYQLGYVHRQGTGLVPMDKLRWEGASMGTFETDDGESTVPLSFVVGSCRNYIRVFGWNMGLEAGDETFRSIVRQVEDGRPLDLFLMIGDQIYADLYWLVDWFYRPRTLAQYNEIHKTAFSTPWLRRLMSMTPTLMQEDDHLFKDNYRVEDARQDPDVFQAALRSFLNYQYYLGPQRGSPERPLRLDFWYTASRKGAQFFFFDTRFERTRDQIISERQLNGFRDWLQKTGQFDLLFLVSPVPMICQENADGWFGYPHQLGAVTRLLIANRRDPVILSGDAHAAYSGQYNVFQKEEGKEEFLGTNRVFTEVVSSGFYAYVYDVPESFKAHVMLPSQGLGFSASSRSRVRTQNLFTRITLAGKEGTLPKLLVQVYAANGSLLDDLSYPLYHKRSLQ